MRCPWHHACFSLKTGEALHAPAFSPLACWKVERRRIFARESLRARRNVMALPQAALKQIPVRRVGGLPNKDR